MYDVVEKGGKLESEFMRAAYETQRLDFLLYDIVAAGSVVNAANVYSNGIHGATFAAFIIDFVKTRGIMKMEDMQEKQFFKILSHLETNAMERGMETFPFSDISSFEHFQKYTMEEFEEMFSPVWALYPYRDEGFVRHLGLQDEFYSFCQWSMEWNINSSSVSCEIARYG